jgi:hypothetical protein
MANTYKCVRLEPQCKYDNKDCVCSVVIGLTADDGEGNSAYIDGTYSYPADAMPTVAEFKAGANVLVSQYAADNGWVASLNSQVAAAKKRNVAPDDFEAPEITMDATVEPAEGSPVKEAEKMAAEEAAAAEAAAAEEEAEEEAEGSGE